MLPPLQSYTLELDREDAEDTSVRFLAPIMGVVVQVRLWFSTGFCQYASYSFRLSWAWFNF